MKNVCATYADCIKTRDIDQALSTSEFTNFIPQLSADTTLIEPWPRDYFCGRHVQQFYQLNSY